MKLTNEELETLKAKRSVYQALQGWSNVLVYLQELVKVDSQKFIDHEVRKRLKLKKSVELQVTIETGEINAVSVPHETKP